MAIQLGSDDPIQIGKVLRETRKRQGIDVATVEKETKIRGKYLRALEDEDWDVLPDPAYTRGFIRAYADLLGLDSEVLVDEYRRRHEEPSTSTYELAEPVLRERLTDERRRPMSRRVILGAIVAEVLILLLILGLVTRGDDGGREAGAGKKAERKERPRKQKAGGGGSDRSQGSKPRQVTVKLVARSDVQACLVDNRGRVLVPNQVLIAGAEDGPYVSKRFRVEVDPTAARIVVNGKRTRTPPSPEPAAYRVTSDGVRPAKYTGKLCS